VTGAGLTDRAIVRRILRAGQREEPGPFRTRLALAEWQRIQQEWRTAELAAMAAYYGAEETAVLAG
jgi:hypothetical protein